MGLVFSNAAGGGPGVFGHGMFGPDSDDSDSDDEYGPAPSSAGNAPSAADGSRSGGGGAAAGGGCAAAAAGGVGVGGGGFEYDPPEARELFRHLRKSSFADAMRQLMGGPDPLLPSDPSRTVRSASPRSASLARARDARGRTPLHVAVRNYRRDPPPQLVALLLRLHPGSAAAVDDEGNTALHYACDACSHERLFRMVLDARPEAALVPNARGELPLHLADSKFATAELARRYPETVSVADGCGKTPLFLFADLLVRHLTVFQGTVLKYDFGPASLDSGVVFHKQCPPFSAISLPDVWSSVATMVRATAHDTVPLLHAAIRFGLCPTIYVKMVCRMTPEQARKRDAWGDLPLHAAARDLMAPGGGGGGGKDDDAADGPGKTAGDGDDDSAAAADEDLALDGSSDEEPGGSEDVDSERGEGPTLSSSSTAAIAAAAPPRPRFRGWEARRRTDELHNLRSSRRGHRRGTDLAEDAVREILDAHPQAARERDASGRLPLQCASAGRGLTWGGGARLMLASYPGALHVGGWGRGRRTPGAAAAAAGGSPSAERTPSSSVEEEARAGKKRRRSASGGAVASASASASASSSSSLRTLDHPRTEDPGNQKGADRSGKGERGLSRDRLDDRLLPRILTKVGRDCALATMFELLSGRPDLVRGGVALRRSMRKRRKRA